MSISIVIPWQDRGNEHRRKAAEYVINYYQSMNIAEVVIGTYPVGDDLMLNRSRLRNNGARIATGDVLVFIDADILFTPRQVLEAAAQAAEKPGAVLLSDHFWQVFTEQESAAIYAGADFQQFLTPKASYYVDNFVPLDWLVAPAFAISKESFNQIGGWDESFQGWGEEDREILWRAHWTLNPTRLVPGPLSHLYHEQNDSEHLAENPNYELFMRKALDVKSPTIAVYAPAKNEEANVAAWAESAKDADLVVLTDTGSTDNTIMAASEAGVDIVCSVAISPWRFDDGFNAALAHVPANVDICIPLHLDERLQPGWRPSLERAWVKGARKFYFNYQWSPTVSFMHDRIHARHGFRWIFPAHETLAGEAHHTLPTEVSVLHQPDPAKDRGQDNRLIELMLQENPKDPRALYYAGRQAYFLGNWVVARQRLDKYLEVANFDQERSEACLFMSDMVFPNDKEKWLLRAISECPGRRETWARLAEFYKSQGFTSEMIATVTRLLRIRQRPDRPFYSVDNLWNDEYVIEHFGLNLVPTPTQ